MATATEKPAKVELDRLTELDNERLRRDIARAESRQKQLLSDRKKSPKGMYIAPNVNQYREQLEQRYVPESIPIDWQKVFVRGRGPAGEPTSTMKPEYRGIFKPGATKQCYWDSKEKHDRTIERGYIPVLNDAGEHVTDGNSDYLYWRDIELTRDDIRRAEEMSKERAHVEDQSVSDMTQAADSSAGAVEMLEDVTEVTQT